MRSVDEVMAELETAGLTPRDRMRLAFRFDAASLRVAVELAETLRMSGHNRVKIRPITRLVLTARRWRVVVTTPPAPVMKAVVELWTEQMSDVARRYDRCIVSDWSALVTPESLRSV